MSALPWPLPALAGWALAWGVFAGLRAVQAPAGLAFTAAVAVGVGCAWLAGSTRWRRIFVAAGFPLSLAATGAAALPAWIWLVPLAALLWLYPRRAWTDAPLFPTPKGALAGLDALVPLPAGARVRDAGCGTGDGLQALHAAYPAAQIEGIEWSAPLAWASRWRCRFAQVRRGDLWADDWSGLDLVYLFQRPESMARAWQKAQRELKPGAWLASLEFPVPEVRPTARLDSGAKPVWLYRR